MHPLLVRFFSDSGSANLIKTDDSTITHLSSNNFWSCINTSYNFNRIDTYRHFFRYHINHHTHDLTFSTFQCQSLVRDMCLKLSSVLSCYSFSVRSCCIPFSILAHSSPYALSLFRSFSAALSSSNMRFICSSRILLLWWIAAWCFDISF